MGSFSTQINEYVMIVIGDTYVCAVCMFAYRCMAAFMYGCSCVRGLHM